MTKIVLLKEGKNNHYQIMYDNDGPYTIGSTLDIDKETVVERLKANNPHSQIEVEQ